MFYLEYTAKLLTAPVSWTSMYGLVTLQASYSVSTE